MSHADTVVQAFTELAPEYEPTMDRELLQFWGITYATFVEQLLQAAAVQPGERVLDVATGTAYLPRKLAGRMTPKGRIVGLDITLAMLQRAAIRRQTDAADGSNGRGASIQLICGSAMAMPIRDQTFDVIVCGLGTHHMAVASLLGEMRRVTRQGGRLVIADVAASAFWRSAAGALLLRLLLWHYGLTQHSARSRAETEAFDNLRTATEWRELLDRSGFGDIDISERRARRPWYPSALVIRATVQ